MASRGERMTVIGVDPSPQPSCRILVCDIRSILAYDALTTDSALIPQVFPVPGLPALPKEKGNRVEPGTPALQAQTAPLAAQPQACR
jgi:hypothetical protein